MSGRPSLDEARIRLRKYCAYQDRSHSEVRNKLLQLKIYGDDLETIIAELVTGGFLNEERFARNYARGKFRMQHWGRQKIINGLRAKRVTDYSINKAMDEIDDAEYLETIDRLLSKHLKGDQSAVARQKAVQALVRKGYEYGLVWDRLRAMDA